MKRILFSKKSLCVIFSCLFMLGHVALSAQMVVFPSNNGKGGDGQLMCAYTFGGYLDIQITNESCLAPNTCQNIKITNIAFTGPYQPTSSTFNYYSIINHSGNNSKTFRFTFSPADWASIIQNNVTNNQINMGVTITYRYQAIGTGKKVVWEAPITTNSTHKWMICGNQLPFERNESPENESSISLEVKPNPATDFINISYKIRETSTVDIILYDMAGRVVKNIITQKQQDDEESNQSVDLSSLDAGIYMLVLKSDEFIKTEKIIKL